ncbi:type II secretion system minor pseudopilin GspK [Massilia cavernae]|uniref:Type II secretion system protein K n=1 Tax=Massilia cavernae TaxID=2320864 RepID=A0A418XQH7_9BURK|nr:type II secretion system minor pseudopilin GspK [Massilia cavernae]RJG14708.1 general secretion pathway protein GspK [Massilia cavernae]
MRLNRQRGVAVITALLLCTLAVSIVASLFWQQQVQVRSMENQRLHLQTKWILRGALDWARLVLRQDGIDSPAVTTLNAVWNTPLAETRLDQYIERERVAGEVFDATLSGRVIDASSRYNLRNLSDAQVQDAKQVEVYANLLKNLQIDPALAKKTAEVVALGEPPPPPPLGDNTPRPPRTTAPIQLQQVEDLLAIPGYTPEIVAKLRDFVIVLPGDPKPKLNVNTAPPEVLAAVIKGYSLSDGIALAARRKQAYFLDMPRFKEQLQGKEPYDEITLDVKSEYFLVQSRIRLDRANLDAEALVERKPGSISPTVLSIRQN